MKFYIPRELTDPLVRDRQILPHGEARPIDTLTTEIDQIRAHWLRLHPGWEFSGTRIVLCSDGTPPPSYDVAVEFQRPRTAEERVDQDRARDRYVRQKEEEFQRREHQQAALLDEVLKDLGSVSPKS